MFIHNLKIAWRNLMKYKFQTIISVVALAVGIVTLTVTHVALEYFGEPPISGEDYYHRIYNLSLGYAENEVADSLAAVGSSIIYYKSLVREDIDALLADGGMACVERIVADNYATYGGQVSVFLSDSVEKTLEIGWTPIDVDYLNLYAIPSAITGEKIPVLAEGDAVISNYKARAIFGDSNPVGKKLIVGVQGEYETFIIRDVFEVSNIEQGVRCDLLLAEKNYRLSDKFQIYGNHFTVLLREGCTAQQLKEEASHRLQPLGTYARVELSEDRYDDSMRMLLFVRVIIYLISSLVLVAALVGFLKMQLQLFRMRRREVSLRVVHGSSQARLYALFFTEVLITLVFAFVLSLLLWHWVTGFLQNHLAFVLEEMSLVVDGVDNMLFVIMAAVAAISAIAVFLSVRSMRNMSRGAAASMARDSNHAFRNTMLALQLVIGMIFLGGTLTLSQFIGGMKRVFNVPENEDFYEQCLYICQDWIDDELFEQYLQHDAENIKWYCSYGLYTVTFDEIQNIPSVKERMGHGYLNVTTLCDTAFLDFWNIPVRWQLPPEQRGECVLLSDSLYKIFDEEGVTRKASLNVSYYGWGKQLGNGFPIGGTFPSKPYYSEKNQAIIISSSAYTHRYIVQPDEGAYADVFIDLQNAIERMNPKLLESPVKNLRDEEGKSVILFDSMQQGAWLLSCICFVVCFMGIWSAVALDTRSRLKEVAVRKVNGAKRRDIALLFGRLYLWLVVVASIISTPVVILFTVFLNDFIIGNGYSFVLSSWLFVAASICITAVVVFLLVFNQIRMVMRLNPSDILAKE